MADKRIDMYLQWATNGDTYCNTEEENELVTKFVALYAMADAAKETNALASSDNIAKWRKAYYGTLETLDRDGKKSKKQARQVRKLTYEFVQAKVDSTIPTPRMIAKHKHDTVLIQSTEDYLNYVINHTYTKYMNDRAERATLTDGTVWYKVWWDNQSNSHETSGEVKLDVCLADQIVPQPGVTDWRKLEYIFELEQVSISRIYDLYGRKVTGSGSNTSLKAGNADNTDLSTVTIVNCYYLNSDRIVGKFSWVKNTQQVICNEECWQIRKVRKCKSCLQTVRSSEICPICGGKSFKYDVVDQDILDEDLVLVYNPYDVGEENDPEKKDELKSKPFAYKGTSIPMYQIHQLPFVPRPATASIESIYGVSEAMLMLEMQDAINKSYTKMIDKTMDSTAVLVKPKRCNVDTNSDGIKQMNVNTYEESESSKVLQVAADTTQDITMASMLYENAKASSGVTDAYQGKYDASATSGTAKEFSAQQSAARIESFKIMKAAAFAGVYDLMLKYLLAFSDEPRKFVKVLPDGEQTEETWNKYMFLAKTDYGEYYYRDDFEFNTDPAATLSFNRVSMWQEIQQQFTLGTFGDVSQDRTRELFWNMMDQQQYPIAKLALAGIKDNAQHLPEELEKLLLENPEVLQGVLQQFQQAGLMQGTGNGQTTGQGAGSGGARANAGRQGTGATHQGSVARNNTKAAMMGNNESDAIQGTSTGGSLA